MTSGYYSGVQNRMVAAIRSFLFAPLAGVIGSYTPQKRALTLLNEVSPSALIEALDTGKIQYRDGIFSGQFDAAIFLDLERIGAVYDRYSEVFRIDPSKVPAYIRMRAALYETTAAEAYRALFLQLDALERELTEGMPEMFEVGGEDVVTKVAEGCAATAKSLAVFPELDYNGRRMLAKMYSNNMALGIKGFTQEMIKSLRRDVQTSAEAGYRFDLLAAKMLRKYDITKAKATFLARTETSIFMAEYRKDRFLAAGVTEYYWRTSGDNRVRDDHKRLNGRRFFYEAPPVADRATGTTANPGGIWNCRCNDQPIVEG